MTSIAAPSLLPSTEPAYPLLDSIVTPGDIRHLTSARLNQLAVEIRALLIEKVTVSGGHLGPNLGVVELTLAVHRVFGVESGDTVLFDTGHQSYVHKLLTGRRDGFDTLRQAGGLSGYPARSESRHDWVENSHASTALSYADGMAKAHQLSGDTGRVVAVIGDGALTGGLAWEALNNLGAAPERPVVVVLNDNGRSYAPTVGAMATHLAELRAAGRGASGRNLFTELGFSYLGPVDGHDTAALEEALSRACDLRRPVVVHALTVKGRGHPPAEADEADRMHAVGPAAPARAPGATRPSWTGEFSRALLALGSDRADLVAITAAMGGPTGLGPFAARFPERYFDVGIAEQHAVTSAAGLAMGGLHPVVAIYATFLNRAFDQVLLDVALHRLPVTFVLDRAGITGPDGPSHHGMWDPTLLSAVPGMRLAVPRDAAQLRELLGEAAAWREGPTALRFPRATAGGDIPAVYRDGPVDVLSVSGTRDVLLVSHGPLAGACLEAAATLKAQGIGVTVCDPRWVLPISPELLRLAAGHRLVVTVEDGLRTNGMGSVLAGVLRDSAITTPSYALGLPTAFLRHASRDQLLADTGLTPHRIVHAVLRARAGRALPHHARTSVPDGTRP
ncbi:1-deoxy-D-xylulose-5-phosphate synthase [Streptomyces tsukubensis]|uniref:1-deoxy-D-xylulose-5-phosphate synthase n=1 Tax=Streptomyces tsukubensis TaxID=83656 RepID=A0A1V4AFB0_9ACTN|nr:1-deoxy-D-xylulose-5-phosphate synthase [Streptomyces tsukubensis]OON82736.1 1-deoxy-D-xylulose-5-phosphate synthase [Streptomyces tsukubensis]QFR92088.1 1-deoxy-D-xylulose-5-phosphate synthase [Streptomyces tsukubensis]